MALGDIENFRQRLRQLIPYSWFPNPAPILWGALSGFAYVATSSYALLKYAKLQTRMATATDAFLDIAAFDFTGPAIQRNPGESDNSFRQRITEEVLRVRLTEQSIVTVLEELTGRIPFVFEPWNTYDVGALDYSIALAGGPFAGVGCVGDDTQRFQVFINAYRPLPGSGFVASDAQIYAAIASVIAAGVTPWTYIQN